jgi:uncharacterized membrane protein YhaH (DUF805 family)
MTDLGLYNYVKNAITRGKTKEEIEAELLKAGWDQGLVIEAWEAVANNQEPMPSDPNSAAQIVPVVAAVPVDISQNPSGLFKGRIGIRQYWKASLTLGLLCVGVSMLLTIMTIPILILVVKSLHGVNGILGVLSISAVLGVIAGGLPYLIALPFLIGLTVRRYHDFGLTGLILLGLAILNSIASIFFPILNRSGAHGIVTASSLSPIGLAITVMLGIVSFVLISWPGTMGANKFGESIHYRSVWAAIRGDARVATGTERSSRALRIFLPIGILLIACVAAMGIIFFKSGIHATSPTTGTGYKAQQR